MFIAEIILLILKNSLSHKLSKFYLSVRLLIVNDITNFDADFTVGQRTSVKLGFIIFSLSNVKAVQKWRFLFQLVRKVGREYKWLTLTKSKDLHEFNVGRRPLVPDT